jgi:fatty aldehyde-generating acyl-ACP reductase
MFGLIGHSTSLDAARSKASSLGYPEYAEGDFEMWCVAPPQLVETVTVTSPAGQVIEGAYIDSVFVPEIAITALGGFTSIIFENLNLLKEQQIRNTKLQWERFTTGNTHTAWVIAQQVVHNAPRLGINLDRAKVAVVGASGDIGSAVCRWLQRQGVGELLLVARRPQPLLDLQAELGSGRVLELNEALAEADVVIWVASLPQGLSIDAGLLPRPCLMIDGGYPKNLDSRFAGDGVHVIKGGIVEFWQDLGWQMMEMADMANPRRQLFACFAEAMLLEFEGIHTNFSWGRNNITLANMDRIGEASLRHGFRALALEPIQAASLVPA